jgi:Mce-associated membrane protein
MATDADAPDAAERGLSTTAGTSESSASPDHTDDTSAASSTEAESTAAEPEAAEGDAETEDYEAAVDGETDEATDPAPAKRSPLVLAAIAGLTALLALTATAGWLGFRAYQSHQAQTQRQLFLQVGRQCALNLTTIDWQHAEGDVQRVLDSATGQFYDQFSKRKQPFIDVITKAQSKSVGTITEAGVESESGDKAQVLVAASIKTSNLGVADQEPRQWRMRITVEQSGGATKISNVAFVP